MRSTELIVLSGDDRTELTVAVGMTVMMHFYAADFIDEYDPEIARSLSRVWPRDRLISESSTASRSLDLLVEYSPRSLDL